MQKLLKRTAQAEKQAARRRNARKDGAQRAGQRVDFNKRMTAVRDANTALREARRMRREDWELGPLAPQRDTPLKSANGAYWGSMSLERSMSELADKQLELACKWAGGRKYLCVKSGDKVAIMEGPDKGKIGVLRSVEEDEGVVTIEGEHLQQNFTVSEHMRQNGVTPEPLYTQLTPMRLPIQAVRLIHPLRDPATGKVRDVVINELAPLRVHRDKPTGRVTWSRVVPGLNIEIPWPRAFEEHERNELEQQVPDNECDTVRSDVFRQTFRRELLSPPMPAEVLDELRNRYSKFRTRHEPEYVAALEAAEAEKVERRKEWLRTMRTPLQELNAKIREERRERGQPVLTDEMLARIGEVMARNSHRAPAVKGQVPETLVSEAIRNAEVAKARDAAFREAQAKEKEAAERKSKAERRAHWQATQQAAMAKAAIEREARNAAKEIEYNARMGIVLPEPEPGSDTSDTSDTTPPPS